MQDWKTRHQEKYGTLCKCINIALRINSIDYCGFISAVYCSHPESNLQVSAREQSEMRRSLMTVFS